MRPLTLKQQQLLALIPPGGIILWLTSHSSHSRFAVIDAGGALVDIGKGWGPTLEALYYRLVLNPSAEKLACRFRFEWGDARQFRVMR